MDTVDLLLPSIYHLFISIIITEIQVYTQTLLVPYVLINALPLYLISLPLAPINRRNAVQIFM